MKRLLLAGAIVVLAGCAAQTPPDTPTAPARTASPPRILHRVLLTSPEGQGVIELRRESQLQSRVETSTYRAYGAIVLADDVGQWRFAYTTTSLEGAGPVPGEWIERLHALSMIVTNTSRNDVQVDWEESVFVDPSGQRHRMIHRGVQLNQLSAPMVPSVIAVGATLNEFVFPAGVVRFSTPQGAGPRAPTATLWHAPPVFERLAPGSSFLVVLAMKAGQTPAPRTFRFSVVAPPAS